MHGAAGQGSGGNQYLLLTPDPSSVCLNCHAGVGAPSSNAVSTTDGSAMTPGGDFYWLTKTFTWIGGSVAGDAHGHNIVAWDYALRQTPSGVAPGGGIFPANRLGCTSCHDPHGRTRVSS